MIDFTPKFLVTPVLTWESQSVQYPKKAGTGVDHFLGKTVHGNVDCLLFYRDGELIGILNYYGFDAPTTKWEQLLGAPEFWERKGNVNIFIHPDHKREGVATALLDLAETKFGPIDYSQQSYSKEGWEFIQNYLARKEGA